VDKDEGRDVLDTRKLTFLALKELEHVGPFTYHSCGEPLQVFIV